MWTRHMFLVKHLVYKAERRSSLLFLSTKTLTKQTSFNPMSLSNHHHHHINNEQIYNEQRIVKSD